MKQLLITLIAIISMASAQGQSLRVQDSILKFSVDTGITNKTIYNKVQAPTVGKLTKQAIDYSLAVADSMKYALVAKVDTGRLRITLDTLFSISDTGIAGSLASKEYVNHQLTTDTTLAVTRRYVVAPGHTGGTATLPTIYTYDKQKTVIEVSDENYLSIINIIGVLGNNASGDKLIFIFYPNATSTLTINYSGGPFYGGGAFIFPTGFHQTIAQGHTGICEFTYDADYSGQWMLTAHSEN